MRSASIRLVCEARIIGHCHSPYPARRETVVDLVLAKARRRGWGHGLSMDFGGDRSVLNQPAIAEFDLQRLRLRVVADRADLARVDAFAFHGHSRDTVMLSPLRTEASCLASPSIFPRTLQRVTSFGSLPSDIGIRPQGSACESPSVQKQTDRCGSHC